MSITRTILHRIPIPNLPGYESRLVRLEYPPGVSAPLHNHPVAATGIILEGEVISQWEGGEVERYSAGESFVDLGETMHVRSENVSQTQKLVMVLSYVIKESDQNVKIAGKDN